MMLVSRFMSGVCVLFMGCGSVFGQGFGLPQGLPPGAEELAGKAISGQMPLILIVVQKPVQAELKIERSQKQRIDAIQANLKGAAMAHMAAGADQAAMLTEFQTQTKATNKELEGILSAEQMVRLKQIALQMQGPQAVLAPEFAAELDLTAEQIEKIKGMTRRDDKALDAILEKDQRAKWHEKIGKPFKGKVPTPPAGKPKPQE
jgi:hypothetical protein